MNRAAPRLVPTLLALAVLAACEREQPAPATPAEAPRAAPAAAAGGPTVDLPKQVGSWIRRDAPRRITADTIFDYMDGGGELYLAYRFSHLDVVEYRASDDSLGTILVELYWMGSSDDAFGLLSTDWGGEAVSLTDETVPAPAPSARALYGAGLLRLRSGDLYARVLASRESPASREQVLSLGRAIAGGRNTTEAPALVGHIRMPAGWAVRGDRLVFFRSHLVLNSAYFLASDDVLGLGRDVDGVTAECVSPSSGNGRARIIVARYPSPDRAASALGTFRAAYLPETTKAAGAETEGRARLEQGWAAYRQNGSSVVIVLDAATREAALALARAQPVS